MATETEQLVVLLEARVSQFEKSFQRANKTASDSWKNMERRGKQAESNINGSFNSVGKQALGLGRTLGVGLGAAAAIAGAQKLIDASTRIDNALKVAGLSGTELTAVYDKLYQSAQNNAAPLESLVQLYGRAALVQKELGVSTGELLKFTDSVAVALRVSGKSAQESSGALLQLSQALGAGTVRAEEFNSMMEGALPIVQAAANGITEAGGSVSKLKNLVNDGKVSSEAFFRGFQAGAHTLNQQVAGATLTVAQGFERVQNAAIDAARRINEAAGISKSAASILNDLAAVVSKLGDGFVWLSKATGESGAAKGISELGAAAKLLWTDPSFQNLYRFLVDPSGSSDALAANDAINAKIRGFKALGDAMRAANAESDKAKKTDGKTPNRFDEAFSAFTPKKISLNDYKPKSDKKTGDGADRDAFDRSLNMISRQTALLGVEISTIDKSTAARERARVVVEMETAARRANEDAGKKNTTVTDEQRKKINELADAYASARERLEALNGPLASFARESANVGQQLENAAVQSLDRMGDELSDVIMGTKTAADAFKSMADMIIKELIKIAIKKAILAPIAGMLGGGGGIGSIFGLAEGGEVRRFATGGPVTGPGSGTSDSIPAMLSDGEFVVNSRATAQHRQLLHAINSGRGVQRYAEGGPVGAADGSPLTAPEGIGSNPITVNSQMTFHFAGAASQLDESKASTFGSEAEAAMIRVLRQEARSAAAAEIRSQIRPGGMLR